MKTQHDTGTHRDRSPMRRRLIRKPLALPVVWALLLVQLLAVGPSHPSAPTTDDGAATISAGAGSSLSIPRETRALLARLAPVPAVAQAAALSAVDAAPHALHGLDALDAASAPHTIDTLDAAVDGLGAGLNWDPIGPGTYHTSFVLRRADGLHPLHVVRIDRSNPFVRLESTLAHGTARGLEPLMQQALARRTPGAAVVAAVNGDFFYGAPVTGLPVGLHMQDGEIVTSPAGPATTAAFGVTADGSPVIDMPRMEARIWLAGDPAMAPGGVDPVPTAWTIDLVNRPLTSLSLALYTPRLGAYTPPIEGTAIIVTGVTSPLKPGVTYTGTVAAREHGTRTNPVTVVIPEDGVVLAARGPAEEFLELLPLGAALQWEVHLSPPFDQVRHAVAGRPVLIRGGEPQPLDIRDSLVLPRHPRTAVGFNDREIFLVTVDGRRPGQADGMSLFELQELMLRLGATEALNLDGGGSTTMVIRPPGRSDPQVVNYPSDGRERPVTNGLVVLSTAPPGRLARLIVRPAAPLALVGSLMPVAVLGQDEHYSPHPVPLGEVRWSVHGDAGQMEFSGVFSALKPGPAVIEAVLGDTRARAPVTVVERVAAVSLYPDTLRLVSGEEFTLRAEAFDATGRRVWANPWQFTWSVEGQAVRVDRGGQVTAVRRGGATVAAHLDGSGAAARITVDQPLVVLSGFDRPGDWLATAVNARASLALSAPGEPVYAGAHAAKLTYDLRTGGGGTAAAYVQAARPIPIPGRPRAIGLWVYGDGSGHWLRGSYIDGRGNRRVTDFTLVRGLDWTGWRYVEAPIDPDAPLPLSFERVYVVEFDPQRQGSGVLYFDHLMAVYGPPGR